MVERMFLVAVLKLVIFPVSFTLVLNFPRQTFSVEQTTPLRRVRKYQSHPAAPPVVISRALDIYGLFKVQFDCLWVAVDVFEVVVDGC